MNLIPKTSNMDFRYNHECSGGEESSSLYAVPSLSLLSSNWTVWTFFPQKSIFQSHFFFFFYFFLTEFSSVVPPKQYFCLSLVFSNGNIYNFGIGHIVLRVIGNQSIQLFMYEESVLSWRGKIRKRQFFSFQRYPLAQSKWMNACKAGKQEWGEFWKVT